MAELRGSHKGVAASHRDRLGPILREQLAKGVSIEEQPVKRAISTQPVVKPIKITAPNSVFALGAALSK